MTLREKIECKNGLLFAAPWIIGFSAFIAYPIIAAVYYSFCNYSVLSPPEWVGLYNYAELFRTEWAMRAIARTFLFSFIALPLSLVFSLCVALLLERRTLGVGLYRTVFFLPALVPQVVVAALLLWIFAAGGVVNTGLAWVGLPTLPWLSRSMILITIMLMLIWGAGHQMIIYLAGLQDVPEELYESAQLDGANYFQRVLHVSVPMISPVILFNLVMGIIVSLGQFTIPFFIQASDRPMELADGANFIATEINRQAIQNLRMGYASAFSTVLLIAVILLTAIVLKVSQRVVHYRGG